MKVLFRFLTLIVAAFVCFACFQPNNCLPPQNVTVTNITDNSALVSWTPASNVSTYQVRLLKLVDSSYQPISTTTVTGRSKTLNNLQANTDYKVEVRSQCSEKVFSSPTSQTFRSGGIIIDDIVFNDGPAPKRKRTCAGTTLINTSIVDRASVILNSGQVMRVNIFEGIMGGKKSNLISQFTLTNRYFKSSRNALWSLIHDDCALNAPSVSANKVDVLSGSTIQGADLVFTRGSKIFKLSFHKSNTNVVTFSLPVGTYARVEIYRAP